MTINAHLAVTIACEQVSALDQRREQLRHDLTEAESSLALGCGTDPLCEWNRQEAYRLRRELAQVETDLATARDRAFEIGLTAVRRGEGNFRNHLKEFLII